MESWSRARRAAVRARGARPPHRPRRPRRDLSSTDGEDLHLHRAGRNDQPDRLPCAVTHERLPYRGLVGDPPLGRSGLGGPDDHVLLGGAIGLHHDVAADLDLVVMRLLVDDDRLLDHLLEGEDAALEERLVVLRADCIRRARSSAPRFPTGSGGWFSAGIGGTAAICGGAEPPTRTRSSCRRSCSSRRRSPACSARTRASCGVSRPCARSPRRLWPRCFASGPASVTTGAPVTYSALRARALTDFPGAPRISTRSRASDLTRPPP